MRAIIELVMLGFGLLIAGGACGALVYKIGCILEKTAKPAIKTFFSELRAEMRANKLGSWHIRRSDEITW